MSQFLNMLKSFPTESVLPLIQNLNPDIIEKIKGFSGGSNLENLAQSPSAALIEETIQTSSPVLADSLQSVSKVYRWRNILIFIIILWAVFLIIARLTNPFPEVQEKIEKTGELMLGNTGIIQIIVTIWISSVLIVTLVPAIISLTPKLETLLNTTSAVLQTVGLKA
jgi:hypothetical protein